MSVEATSLPLTYVLYPLWQDKRKMNWYYLRFFSFFEGICLHSKSWLPSTKSKLGTRSTELMAVVHHGGPMYWHEDFFKMF